MSHAVASGISPHKSLADDGLITTLVVDDEPVIRGLTVRFLTSLGHEVIAVESGAEALAVIRRRKITLIILDIRLPDVSGLDLLPQFLDYEPHAAVLMFTGDGNAVQATASLHRGAMDYLVKPLDLQGLEQAVGRALERRRALLDEVATQAWLKQEIIQRGADLQRERATLERISVATLEALVNALEAKDPYLRGHSARIADLAALIGAELGCADTQIETIRTAGRLHDIGKIGVRESVLGKRGPLTHEEFTHVKTHVTIGAQILAPMTHLGEIIAMVRGHHERVDGTGYPDGLRGAEIPLGARILAAAEVYDALTTSRPYQEKMTPEQAVDRMRDLVGTTIDADVHRALSAAVGRRKALVFLDEHSST